MEEVAVKRYVPTALAVAAAVGVFIYISVFDRGPKKDVADEVKPALFTIAQDAAQRVEINNNGLLIVLERRGKDWAVARPRGIRANQQAAEQLVFILSEFQVERKIEDKAKDLSIYGLDKPPLTVAVTARGNKRYSFKVGKHTPVTMSYYAEGPAAGSVYEVPAENIRPFLQGLDFIRDKSVADLRFDDAVSTLSVEAGGKKVVCERDEKNEWSYVGGKKRGGCDEVAESLAAAISSAEAQEYFSEAARDTIGALPARWVVALTTQAKKRIALKIGDTNRKNEFYAENPDRKELYVVKKDLPDAAEKFVKSSINSK